MKANARYLGFCALFLCCTLLCSSLFYASNKRLLPLAADTAQDETPVIILDAGHGGEDGGAIGTNGIAEKELNLALTSTLACMLRGAGYTVVETRTEDKLLYDADTQKGHKKQGDLKNRLEFTKQYPSSIFISIHMNTFPTPSCTGTQVWYSQNNEQSMEWASAIQERVRELLQPQNNRKIKAATSSIYILKHAQTPAILVECGFLSTPSECERLCEREYRDALALTLFAAICEKMQAQSCAAAENVV